MIGQYLEATAEPWFFIAITMRKYNLEGNFHIWLWFSRYTYSSRYESKI